MNNVNVKCSRSFSDFDKHLLFEIVQKYLYINCKIDTFKFFQQCILKNDKITYCATKV